MSNDPDALLYLHGHLTYILADLSADEDEEMDEELIDAMAAVADLVVESLFVTEVEIDGDQVTGKFAFTATLE